MGDAPFIDGTRQDTAEVVTRELMHAMTGPTAPAACASTQPPGGPTILVCELAEVDEQGVARVLLPGRAEPVAARTVVALPRRWPVQVLVVQETSGGGSPIVTGVLREPAPAPVEDAGPPFELELDDERVVLGARRQLVLRCGQASVTLTREGKILLRGTYVSSQSSGVHRINGASVEIN